MTKTEAAGMTFKKRLGVITNLEKAPPEYPGVYVAGKYWWSKGSKSSGRPLLAVMPDQWEDTLKSEKLAPLPAGVTVALGPYDEMIVLK